MSLGRVVHAQVVADLADHHLAGVDPHPDRELEPAGSERARIGMQLAHRRKGGVARSPRVVLVGDGRPEERHHAVACELVDRALEAMNAGGEDREDAIEHAMPFLRAEALREPHRIDHVSEEHADLLALPFEGAARGENPLDEVARGIGARVTLGGAAG